MKSLTHLYYLSCVLFCPRALELLINIINIIIFCELILESDVHLWNVRT